MSNSSMDLSIGWDKQRREQNSTPTSASAQDAPVWMSEESTASTTSASTSDMSQIFSSGAHGASSFSQLGSELRRSFCSPPASSAGLADYFVDSMAASTPERMTLSPMGNKTFAAGPASALGEQTATVETPDHESDAFVDQSAQEVAFEPRSYTDNQPGTPPSDADYAHMLAAQDRLIWNDSGSSSTSVSSYSQSLRSTEQLSLATLSSGVNDSYDTMHRSSATLKRNLEDPDESPNKRRRSWTAGIDRGAGYSLTPLRRVRSPVPPATRAAVSSPFANVPSSQSASSFSHSPVSSNGPAREGLLRAHSLSSKWRAKTSTKSLFGSEDEFRALFSKSPSTRKSSRHKARRSKFKQDHAAKMKIGMSGGDADMKSAENSEDENTATRSSRNRLRVWRSQSVISLSAVRPLGSPSAYAFSSSQRRAGTPNSPSARNMHVDEALLSSSSPSGRTHLRALAESPPSHAASPMTIRRTSGGTSELSPDAVAQLLCNDFSMFDNQRVRLTIIDCRFPYEFAGGHLRGALNLYMPEMIENFLFSDDRQVPEEGERHVLLFHCEFSSKRGPTLLRHARAIDRKNHASCYPQLTYPDLYLLTGGYAAFCDRFAPEAAARGRRRVLSTYPAHTPESDCATAQFASNVTLSTPNEAPSLPPEQLFEPLPAAYVCMHDPQYRAECKTGMRQLKRKAMFRKTLSMGDLLDPDFSLRKSR